MNIAPLKIQNARVPAEGVEGAAPAEKEKAAENGGFAIALELLSAALMPTPSDVTVATEGGKKEPVTGKGGNSLPVALPVALPPLPGLGNGAAIEAVDLEKIIVGALGDGGEASRSDAKVAKVLQSLSERLAGVTRVDQGAIRSAAGTNDPVPLAQGVAAAKAVVTIDQALQVVRTAMPEAAQAIEGVLGGKIVRAASVESANGLVTVELKAEPKALNARHAGAPNGATLKVELSSRDGALAVGQQQLSSSPEGEGSEDVGLRVAATKSAIADKELSPALPKTGAEMHSSFLASSAAAPQQPAVAAVPRVADVPAAASAQRFEELVQAISHARETGSSQPIKATVSHAEFGVVALRLARDDGGMSAIISSADPTFAPAAHAAVRAMADGSAANGRMDDQARNAQQQSQSEQGGQGPSNSASNSSGHEQRSQQSSRNERFDSQRGLANSKPEKGADEKTARDGGLYA